MYVLLNFSTIYNTGFSYNVTYIYMSIIFSKYKICSYKEHLIRSSQKFLLLIESEITSKINLVIYEVLFCSFSFFTISRNLRKNKGQNSLCRVSKNLVQWNTRVIKINSFFRCLLQGGDYGILITYCLSFTCCVFSCQARNRFHNLKFLR